VTSPGPANQLRIVLEQRPEAPIEPEFVADAPLVGFDAFSRDQHLYGWVRLVADRLTDLLNAHDQVRLVNVLIEPPSGGVPTAADEIVVARAELVAVQATGPRGDPRHRHPTRAYPVVVESGPYLIGGHLHVRPGADPLAELVRRPPMVPLTSAWIEYWADGRRCGQWIGTLIVNREAADRVALVAQQDLEFGQLAPGLIAEGPGAA
jgi:hypothetical protein